MTTDGETRDGHADATEVAVELAHALAALDAHAAPEALTSSRAPYLIGVRHHSAALAAVMPSLLDAFAPTRVLIELPADLGPWLSWLGAPDLRAPVALSAASGDGVVFVPFADFSPELVAIRWAYAHGVPVEAIDRPVGAHELDDAEGPRAGRLTARLHRGDEGGEELWEELIESRAPAPPESLRRAALAFGWLLRADALHGGGISREDTAREGYMRACVERSLAVPGARVCAIVGAFHANALLETPVLEDAPTSDVPLIELAMRSTTSDDASDASDARPPIGALVPYDFELFDARSGYPAGILDPALAQHAVERFSVGEGLDAAIPTLLVEIARALRERGHVASFADVREASRLAIDLAALRGLRGPGRRELLEGITTAMAQGEPEGRGRVLARAMADVLIGHRRGALPQGAPRTGLSIATEAELRELGLPGPEETRGKDFTLDPRRSALDRRRAIFLGRLAACDVPYAELRGGDQAGARGAVETLTTRVRLRFAPECAARLELVALFGATPAAAAEGCLRRALVRLVEEDVQVAEGWLALVRAALAADLGTLVEELFARRHTLFVACASLAELHEGIALCARLQSGQVATFESSETFESTLAEVREELVRAALGALEGIVGSEKDEDVRALAELLTILDAHDSLALRHALDRFAREGSATMQGAGHAARALVTDDAASFSTASAGSAADFSTASAGSAADFSTESAGSAAFFATFASWFEHGLDEDADAARFRAAALRGALIVDGGRSEGDPRFVAAILEGLERLEDARFLARLPSLRAGFSVLSSAARKRFLEVLGAPLTKLELPSEGLASFARADRAGRAAIEALGLELVNVNELAPDARASGTTFGTTPHAIGLIDRVRLVMGHVPDDAPPQVLAYARALVPLYGGGEGEGSRQGADTGAAWPTAREWADELAALFDERVREEVLASAAERGDASVLALLDPERVAPSIALLEQILALRGGMPESEIEPLRRLARRVVDALVQELARTLRPALAGLATPRPTRRAVGPLDLARTVRASLETAHEHEGALRLAPRRFLFRTRARRSLDWRVVVVVDVSGSMEASVIHAAMMASILAGLPAVTTHFLTVNDRVVDLSDHVSDPLELLLSVQIGGGTVLSRGLRHARELLRVPSRSIVVLVSDFEEGGSVSALVSEARALVDAGAKVLGLAALDERRAPRYHRGIARQLVDVGMPIAALSPLELAGWVRDVMRGETR